MWQEIGAIESTCSAGEAAERTEGGMEGGREEGREGGSVGDEGGGLCWCNEQQVNKGQSDFGFLKKDTICRDLLKREREREYKIRIN